MIVNMLSKTYNGRRVLEIDHFQIPPNSLCALIGANGSGKSTLARILAGTESPDNRASVQNPEGLRVGYMPQHSYGFQMSVLKNVLLGMEDTAANRAQAMQLLAELDVAQLARQSARRLSGGETARMALARLLLRDSELLIFDEPTAAMDVRSTLIAEALINSYRQSHSCRLLLVTHSLKQAQRLADYVGFLHEGRLLEFGPAAQVLTAPQQELTREFLDFYAL